MSFGIEFDTAEGMLRRMKKISFIVSKISEDER